MREGSAQLGLAAGVHRRVEVLNDTFPVEFEALAFGLDADLLGAESGLTWGVAAGSGFFLLRFDVFGFPAAGHVLIMPSHAHGKQTCQIALAVNYGQYLKGTTTRLVDDEP